MTRRLFDGARYGLYVVVVSILCVVTKALFCVRVEGRENIRPNEGYIAVARHRSYWDIPLMAVALGATKRVHFIARKGLMRFNPVARALVALYATAIDREHFGKSDFRRMMDSIKRERLIGVFPEGTTRDRVDAKAGAVYFADVSGKQLLPVNIRARGPYPPKYPFRLPRIRISIGAPIGVDALADGLPEKRARNRRYKEMSDRLMKRIDCA